MRHAYRVALVSAVLAMVSCGQLDPSGNNDEETGADEQALVAPSLSVAEAIYGDYQAAAQGKVQFALTSVGSGKLKDIAAQPLNDTLGVPAYEFVKQSDGPEITTITRSARNTAEDEWSSPVLLTEFDKLNHPVRLGTYRLLSVKVTLDGVESTHRSLLACWTAQNYCLVMDPAVQQLDAFVSDRKANLAAGWAKAEEPTTAAPPVATDGVGIMRVCSVNSHPTWGGIQITYPAWDQRYKNVFGMTLVYKHLAGQQAGISCFINSNGYCRSSGFGYSNDSSCSGTLGYSCDCANTGNQNGSSQPSTRSWSQTKCAHKLVGSASVSWTRSGSGSGFSINWDTNGGVDSNGGTLYDACSYH